jgi:hypothetical protein
MAIKTIYTPTVGNPAPTPYHYGSVAKTACLPFVPTKINSLVTYNCEVACVTDTKLFAFPTDKVSMIFRYGFTPIVRLEQFIGNVISDLGLLTTNSRGTVTTGYQDTSIYTVEGNWNTIYTLHGYGYFRIAIGAFAGLYTVYSDWYCLKEATCNSLDNTVYIEGEINGLQANPHSTNVFDSFYNFGNKVWKNYYRASGKLHELPVDYEDEEYLIAKGITVSQVYKHRVKNQAKFRLELFEVPLKTLKDIGFFGLLKAKITDYSVVNSMYNRVQNLVQTKAFDYDQGELHHYINYIQNANIELKQVLDSSIYSTQTIG